MPSRSMSWWNVPCRGISFSRKAKQNETKRKTQKTKTIIDAMWRQTGGTKRSYLNSNYHTETTNDILKTYSSSHFILERGFVEFPLFKKKNVEWNLRPNIDLGTNTLFGVKNYVTVSLNYISPPRFPSEYSFRAPSLGKGPCKMKDWGPPGPLANF